MKAKIIQTKDPDFTLKALDSLAKALGSMNQNDKQFYLTSAQVYATLAVRQRLDQLTVYTHGGEGLS